MKFGDYVLIEQQRYGCGNEFYKHKVVNILESNLWTDVPVQTPAQNIIHKESVQVALCICCGASQNEIHKYRIEDLTITEEMKNIKKLKTELFKLEKSMIWYLNRINSSYVKEFLNKIKNIKKILIDEQII